MKRLVALIAVFLVLLTVSARATDDNPSYVELKDGPSITVDWSKGRIQAVTIAGNRKVSFEAGQKGKQYLLIVTQDAVGSRIISWPDPVRWPGHYPATLTTLAGKTDYVTFFFNGKTYDVVSLSLNY